MKTNPSSRKKYQTAHISFQKLHHLWWRFHLLIESEQHIWMQPPNVLQLCNQLDTNQKYLSQTINQSTGLTIVSFFHCYRIERFIQKLNNGEAQLKTIDGLISEVGFQNRTSFYRAFKNFMGVHPTQFIKQLKERKAI